MSGWNRVYPKLQLGMKLNDVTYHKKWYQSDERYLNQARTGSRFAVISVEQKIQTIVSFLQYYSSLTLL